MAPGLGSDGAIKGGFAGRRCVVCSRCVVGSTDAAAWPGGDETVDRLDPTAQAIMAIASGFGNARLVRINLVESTISGRCEVGHDNVGASIETKLSSLGDVDGGQGGGAGDVGFGTDQPSQGDDLISHQLGIGDLIIGYGDSIR